MLQLLRLFGTALCLTIALGYQAAHSASIDEQMATFYELSKAKRNSEALAMLDIPGFITAQDSDGHTPLIVAATTGNKVLLDAVLKAPQNLDHGDSKGCTAVWFMSGAADSTLLKQLLQRGASATKPCNNGLTPLMAAAMANRADAVQTLLDAKAPIDTEHQGSTALGFAVAAGHEAVVHVLLNAGANAKASMRGNKLVDIAKKRGFHNIERLLRKHGAT